MPVSAPQGRVDASELHLSFFFVLHQILFGCGNPQSDVYLGWTLLLKAAHGLMGLGRRSPAGTGLICDSSSMANVGGLCLWTVLEDADTGWEQWRGGTQAEGEGWMPHAAIPITGGAARVTAS